MSVTLERVSSGRGLPAVRQIHLAFGQGVDEVKVADVWSLRLLSGIPCRQRGAIKTDLSRRQRTWWELSPIRQVLRLDQF